MLHDIGAQAFPIQMQRLLANGIQISFIGVDGQLALRISGFVKQWAGAVFFGQIHRGFEQVILNRFKGAVGKAERGIIAVAHAVFGQIISIIDHAYAQRAPVHGGDLGGFNRVILIIEQGIERAHGQVGQAFQLIQAFERAQIECRQSAQRDFAVFIVDVV